MSPEQTEPLTNDMIRKLRSEAGAAGDFTLAAECHMALAGKEECRWAVANAINAARGMDDSKPFVRVVAE